MPKENKENKKNENGGIERSNISQPDAAAKRQEKEIKLSMEQVAQLYENERNKLDSMQKSLEAMIGMRNEIDGTIQAITAIQKLKEKEKILTPLGSGILIEASIENKNESLATLPGNILIKKDFAAVISDFTKRLEELEKTINGMQEEMAKTANNINSLATILNQQQRQQRKNQEQGSNADF